MRPTGPSQAADARHAAVAAVREGIVSRGELFARLGAAARVTQISAPAGSGKTFLLRSWIGEAGLADRTAWVSVQGGEREPRRFWIAVLDALRETTIGSKLVRPQTPEPDGDGWAVMECLLEDLAALGERIWLVLDDVHQLDSAEALCQLRQLMLRAQPRLRFVLVARGDLRLGLHRLRLEGELTEVRATDLRFSVDEARALLAAAEVRLPEPALALLVARTEGWAAGLRLAAFSLTGHPDPERFVAEFSGSERTVADYLLAEVLDRQGEEIRRLLLRTSVLERVSGDLAELLTGEPGGERILQDLEDAGAFVVAVDARRSWFRYHRLFADLLRMELRRSAPGTLTALHADAAAWHAEHGHPVEAIRHAQAAGDCELAARLLAEHLLGLVLNGQGAIAHELLTQFPPDVVTADPELAALRANDEVTRESLEAAQRYLAGATRGSASGFADRRGCSRAAVAVLRLSLAWERGDLRAIAEQARRLLDPGEDAGPAQAEPGDELRALALVSLGVAELWAHQGSEAEPYLEQGIELARRSGRSWLELTGLAHGAWTASFRSFGLAADRGMRAIKLAEEHGWTEEPGVAVAYAAVGAIRVWQMRLEEAEALLEQAERVPRAGVEPAARWVLHQARGMLELARGRDAEALMAFRSTERLAGLPAAHPCSTAMRAHALQTLVRTGETGSAEAALAGLDSGQRERGEIRNAVAALRLAQHDPQAAAAALAPVLDGSAPVTNPGEMTQAFLLEAIARDALGDPAAAGRALERALDLAEPDGAVFAFLLHPAPRLLRRHARNGTAYAALISAILNPLSGGYGESRTPGGVHRPPGAQPREPLSDSETRVLRYLPTNLAASEIAGELSLSVHTVRTHIRHLYEKLGAHRRTEAVELARAFGMLAPSPHRRADSAKGEISRSAPTRASRSFR
jgi:LuxR family transcriptional regulator, maltose regulon positive regulatory protein